jgi:hypothetical protein
MNATYQRSLKLGIGTAAALAVVLAASCASLASPKQVQASTPTVTYKYHNDDELVQTNQLASDFCGRYQSVPRSINFSRDGDDNIVVYECVSTSHSPTYRSEFNPNLSYTYRTDQELLNGSQNAQAYCSNNGSSRVSSNIVRNSNGTRTVTFQCRQN